MLPCAAGEVKAEMLKMELPREKPGWLGRRGSQRGPAAPLRQRLRSRGAAVRVPEGAEPAGPDTSARLRPVGSAP